MKLRRCRRTDSRNTEDRNTDSSHQRLLLSEKAERKTDLDDNIKGIFPEEGLILMINIAICDDQSLQLAKVKSAVEGYFKRFQDYTARIDVFDNSSLFLDALIKTGGWDIVILDICMPGISGTELAREIRRRKDRTEIIFISVSSEFALDAFVLNAVHYVLKPFTDTQLEEALDRALASFAECRPKRILLQLGNGAVQSLDINEISYIESIAYRRVVHTDNGIFEETRKTLSGFMEEFNNLSPGQFIQPYRGYIVNQNVIRTITPEHLVLHNGDSILIKRGDFRRLREIFFSWSFRNGGN